MIKIIHFFSLQKKAKLVHWKGREGKIIEEEEEIVPDH